MNCTNIPRATNNHYMNQHINQNRILLWIFYAQICIFVLRVHLLVAFVVDIHDGSVICYFSTSFFMFECVWSAEIESFNKISADSVTAHNVHLNIFNDGVFFLSGVWSIRCQLKYHFWLQKRSKDHTSMREWEIKTTIDGMCNLLSMCNKLCAKNSKWGAILSRQSFRPGHSNFECAHFVDHHMYGAKKKQICANW